MSMSFPFPFPFLRPMALPRPSTITRFLSTARASSTANPAPAATAAPAPASTSQAEKGTAAAAAYWVTKTGTHGIPVYQLSKRGGNLHQTKVRRIEGDIMALRTDLQTALRLEDREIVINQLTQHIIIKVWVMVMVMGFCSLLLLGRPGRQATFKVHLLNIFADRAIRNRRW